MKSNGVSNAISAPYGQSYPPTVTKPVKKLMFAQTSCQSGINTTISINFKPISVDLCQTRWFFALMISVACITIFNVSITLWIINVLHLTNNGLGFGSLVLTKKGINFKNDVKFDELLNAKNIKGFSEKQAININSDLHSNQIVMRNNEFLENSLSIGNGKLEIQASNFQIRTTNIENNNINDILFNIKPNEITTYTQNLMSPTLGGYKIINSLDTNSIHGTVFQDLRLESRTQQVNIEANTGIDFESKGGDIQFISHDNIKLRADNMIVFNTKRLEIKNIRKHDGTHIQNNAHKAYQVCICESGMLFVVSHRSVCISDADVCQTNHHNLINRKDFI